MRGRRFDPTKRAIDILAAAAGLVLTAPIQLIVGALVRARLGKPILFKQMRPGRDERVFLLVKFRTMAESDPAHGLVSDADRMTRLGSVLRSTSLDELPTLWNVLRGDMSLVGPRPLLMSYLDLYSPQQRRRHEVRPGVTGLAQVSGRNGLGWDERLSLDVEYVDRRSAWLDLRILMLTIGKVVTREGIAERDQATMSEFRGSADDE